MPPSSLPGSFDLSWLRLVLMSVSEVLIPRLPSGFMETTHVLRERPEPARAASQLRTAFQATRPNQSKQHQPSRWNGKGRWPFPNFTNKRKSLQGSAWQSKPLQHHPAMNYTSSSLCSKDGRCSPKFGSEGRSCQTHSGFIGLCKQAVVLVIAGSPLGFWRG